MTYADYQNTEPDFQDGPSDLPDRIAIVLPLTGPQIITMRAALWEARDRATANCLWSKASHIKELIAAIDQQETYFPCAK